MGLRDRQWVYGLSDLHMKWSWCAEETCHHMEDAGGVGEGHPSQGSKRRGEIAYILNLEIQLKRSKEDCETSRGPSRKKMQYM